MIVAVDFDGTCVRHAYPEIGAEVPGAVATLRALVLRGDSLILWTVRSGVYLDAAVEWFRDRELPLWGVNQNPTQGTWSPGPKAHAEAYIDDAAVGAPVLRDPGEGQRPYVDWARVWCWFGFEWPDSGRPYRWYPAETVAAEGISKQAPEPYLVADLRVRDSAEVPAEFLPGFERVPGTTTTAVDPILREANGVPEEVMLAVDAVVMDNAAKVVSAVSQADGEA